MGWARMAKYSPLIRVVVFVGLVVLVWLPLALPLYRLSGLGYLPGGDLGPTALLYVIFLALLPHWQRRVHGLQRPWGSVGFTGQARLYRGLWQGGLLGLLGLVALVLVQVGLGWATWNPIEGRALVAVMASGALTALAVGWSEEILFRGWLLGELERGFAPGLALGLSAVIFAIAHFIKPLSVILSLLPQFFGLLLLGLTLGWARRITLAPTPGKTGLGHPVGLHGGLVWGYYVVNVGHLITSTEQVPPWVTGIDGNPLAGLLGILLLGGLGALFWRWAED